MKYSFLSLIVAVVFFFGFGLNSPGVVFEVETTYHSGSPGVESSEMSVEGKNLKMEILPGSNAEAGAVKDEVIFRGDRKQVVVVDHKDKSFMVIDEAYIKNMAGKLNNVQTEMDEMMKNLPDDVKKQIEEARKQGVNIPGMSNTQMPHKPKMEVNKSNEKGTKEGYPCVKYEIFRDGQKIQELWVTDWDNINGGGEAEAAFRSMAEFFEEMMKNLPDMGGDNSPLGDPDTNFAKMMSEVGGFPVVTRDFDDNGDLESESLLKSTKRGWIDPEAFEPPSGYKRMSMGPQ